MIPNDPSIPYIFDQRHLRRNRDRAASADASHHFLIDWCVGQLAERLLLVRRDFPRILQLGALTGWPVTLPGAHSIVTADIAAGPLRNKSGARVQAAPDMLPFADDTFDLVISPFILHTVNDLPGALTQIRRVLKPDGLFIAAMAGGETLHGLRQCLMDAEIAMRGGASPRVFPFADKQQMGALMQRAGFALPVVDSDRVVVTYDTAFGLMKDLRLMGESNIVSNRDKTAGRSLFIEAARLYQDRHSGPDGRIEAVFEVIFLLGWAPHASQQKPLRPGQATARLADALEAVEQAAGEKVAP